MACCHNCPRRRVGCGISCKEWAAEKLVKDLQKIKIRKIKDANHAAENIIIRRWEHNHRRKSRIV